MQTPPIPLESPSQRRSYAFLGLVFLALTAALALYWSHLKLMDNDEYLSFYGDSAPTVGEVVRIQLHYPISLDPPAYHILSHLSMDVIGRNELAMRLPALFGFLTFQAGLFLFVRRLAGSRAALVALLLPVTGTMYHYAVVGRPYGLLLGLYAISLVLWQTAARRYETGQPRLLLLVGISLALGLAITSHYFGVLILLPVCLAELARTLHRRRFDLPMLAALFAGLASVALILPFRKAVLVYQQHYYITAVAPSIIREAYRGIFFHYYDWPGLYRAALAAMLVGLLLVVGVATWLRVRRRAPEEPVYDWVALAAIAALPVFGFLFGHFVTHTMEVRYVMAWQFAAIACAAIVLEPLLRRNAIFYTLLAVILLGGFLIQKRELDIYRADRLSKLASMSIPAALRQQILANPNRRIYIQSLENYYTDEHYEPDAAIRARFSYVYGLDQELGLLGHDTNTVTARNMQHFTTLSIVPYDLFLRDREPLLLLYHNGWEWIEQDLRQRNRVLTPIGPILRGDLLQVSNP